jgi:hypothetical protein
MTHTPLRSLAIALSAMAIQCLAADSVRVTYHPGYPLPGLSTERVEVVVTRSFTWPGSDAEIDKYFNSVTKIVAQLEQRSNCGVMPIHSPTVTVRIDQGDHTFSRVCAVLGTGAPMRLNASPEEVAHDQAFERLLKLTVERSNALLLQ